MAANAITGKSFSVHLHRKENAATFKSVNNKIKVREEVVDIDPQQNHTCVEFKGSKGGYS